MNYKIAVLSGDGIGPEVTKESEKILDSISKKFGHQFEYDYQDVGGVSIDKNSVHGSDSVSNAKTEINFFFK